MSHESDLRKAVQDAVIKDYRIASDIVDHLSDSMFTLAQLAEYSGDKRFWRKLGRVLQKTGEQMKRVMTEE